MSESKGFYLKNLKSIFERKHSSALLSSLFNTKASYKKALAPSCVSDSTLALPTAVTPAIATGQNVASSSDVNFMDRPLKVASFILSACLVALVPFLANPVLAASVDTNQKSLPAKASKRANDASSSTNFAKQNQLILQSFHLPDDLKVFTPSDDRSPKTAAKLSNSLINDASKSLQELVRLPKCRFAASTNSSYAKVDILSVGDESLIKSTITRLLDEKTRPFLISEYNFYASQGFSPVEDEKTQRANAAPCRMMEFDLSCNRVIASRYEGQERNGYSYVFDADGQLVMLGKYSNDAAQGNFYYFRHTNLSDSCVLQEGPEDNAYFAFDFDELNNSSIPQDKIAPIININTEPANNPSGITILSGANPASEQNNRDQSKAALQDNKGLDGHSGASIQSSAGSVQSGGVGRPNHVNQNAYASNNNYASALELNSSTATPQGMQGKSLVIYEKRHSEDELGLLPPEAGTENTMNLAEVKQRWSRMISDCDICHFSLTLMAPKKLKLKAPYLEVSFKDNQLDGYATNYDTDKRIKGRTFTFANDALNGPVFTYENGKISRIDSYIDFKKKGASIVYDKSGYIKNVYTYTNDDGSYHAYEFDRNGLTRSLTSYQDAKTLDGPQLSFADNGLVANLENYALNHKDGYAYDFKNGVPYKVDFYKNNKLNGPEVIFSGNGHKTIKLYQDGIIHGEVRFDSNNRPLSYSDYKPQGQGYMFDLYQNGSLKAVGLTNNDKVEGSLKVLGMEGSILYIIQMHNSLPLGIKCFVGGRLGSELNSEELRLIHYDLRAFIDTFSCW